jgi:hypothetical protein
LFYKTLVVVGRLTIIPLVVVGRLILVVVGRLTNNIILEH